ncbi:hypothetical protein [Acanthamoeba polyphaga mimivirus]|nr:hypothetical protein [Acanthamoeba castellanii mamavirus]UMZ07889.1 hypothetical protein [Acanthamoeba polyphaga mimivirus]
MDPSILSQLKYKTYNYSRSINEYFITRDDNSDIKYFNCLLELPTNYIDTNTDFISFINLDVFFYKLDYTDYYRSRKKFKICSAYITDLRSFKLKGVINPATNFNSFNFPQFTKTDPLIIKLRSDFIYFGVKFECELCELSGLVAYTIDIRGKKYDIPKNIEKYLNFSNQLEYFEGYIEMNYSEPTEYELILRMRSYNLDIFHEFYLYDINFYMMNSDSEIIKSLNDVAILEMEWENVDSRIDFKSFTEDNMLHINTIDDVPMTNLPDVIPTDCFFLVKFIAKKLI